MLKVSSLIKYLNENNGSPQSLTPIELTFLNFLTYGIEPHSLVTSETIEQFFRQCLEYPHWQQNRALLGQEIRELFQGQNQEGALIDDLAQVKWPEQTQVIEIQNPTDLTDVLQGYLNSQYKKGEKYRLVVEKDKVFAVILRPDFGVTVQYFDKKMVINNGHLEPLRKDLCLHYTPDLELDSEKLQKIEIAPYSVAQFYLRDGKLTGSLVRGYTLQKSFDLLGAPLESFPKLFYALKRVEQHFLSRDSDPFYQQTLNSLENAIGNLQKGLPESVQQATDTMAKTQNILEYVFTGDRVLALLLRDLQHTLALRHQRTVVTTGRKAEAAKESPWNNQASHPTSPRQTRKQFVSTNSSPTAESLVVELLID